MQDLIYKHRKRIIIVAGVVVILVLAVSVYNIIMNARRSVTLNITVTPSIAEVKIGGKKYSSIGEYKIEPGEYAVEASAEGFVTKAGTLVAVENETVNVMMYLEPAEGNENWYSEHPEDALVLGDIKSDYAREDFLKLAEEKPILTELPIEIDYYTRNYAKRVKYTISYVLNEDITDFVITITDYTGGNYEDALTKLTARGVDLSDYSIQYIDESTDLDWGYAG